MSVRLSEAVAVVLAGGLGTRVRHLLPGVPKPMAQVAGKPFLEWVVRYLARQGLRQVVFSTGFLSEVVENYFRHHPVPDMDIRSAPEQQPLGTAGGFLNAVRQSQLAPQAWLVLNGDSLAFANLSLAAARLDATAAAGVLIGCPVADASRYGTLAIGPGNELLGFEEKRPGRGVISAGMYFLRQELLREFPERLPLSFEKDVFPCLIGRRLPLQVCEVTAPFLDIGTPETLPQAEQFVAQNRAEFTL